MARARDDGLADTVELHAEETSRRNSYHEFPGGFLIHGCPTMSFLRFWVSRRNPWHHGNGGFFDHVYAMIPWAPCLCICQNYTPTFITSMCAPWRWSPCLPKKHKEPMVHWRRRGFFGFWHGGRHGREQPGTKETNGTMETEVSSSFGGGHSGQPDQRNKWYHCAGEGVSYHALQLHLAAIEHAVRRFSGP